MRKFLIFFGVLLISYSCSEKQLLKQDFEKHKSPLGYRIDSEIADCEKKADVTIGGIRNQVLEAELSIAEVDKKIKPYIVYNYFETKYDVTLGQNLLEQQYSDFFKQSFINESQRAGCYNLTGNPSRSDYLLEFTFKNCKTTADYTKISTIYFFVIYALYEFEENGSRAKTELELDVKLKKGNSLVFQKQYSIDRKQYYYKHRQVNFLQSREDFILNMVKSLSVSTKECIEKIIVDLNRVFDSQ